MLNLPCNSFVAIFSRFVVYRYHLSYRFFCCCSTSSTNFIFFFGCSAEKFENENANEKMEDENATEKIEDGDAEGN